MKSHQISIIVASLILGLSFIIGCSLIDINIGSERETDQIQAVGASDKALMTMEEAADFLNIGKDQIIEIIKIEHNILNETGVYQGTMFPYIRVDSDYLFNKEILLKWIRDASTDRSVYLKGQKH
jgi:hypothetical protein